MPKVLQESGRLMMDFIRQNSRLIAGGIAILFLLSAIIPLLTLFMN